MGTTRCKVLAASRKPQGAVKTTKETLPAATCAALDACICISALCPAERRAPVSAVTLKPRATLPAHVLACGTESSTTQQLEGPTAHGATAH